MATRPGDVRQGGGVWTISALWIQKAEYHRRQPGGQWDLEGPRIVSALSPLHSVWERIEMELDDYEEFVRTDGDSVRLEAVRRVRAWLGGEGKQLREQLERQIDSADSEGRRDMQLAIEATLSMADLHRSDDELDIEDRDLLLQWCNEVLYTLERAFREVEGQLDTIPDPLTGPFDAPRREPIWVQVEIRKRVIDAVAS